MAASPIDQAETPIQDTVVNEMRKIRDSISRIEELLQAMIAGNPAAGAVIGQLKRSISRASGVLDCLDAGIGTGSPGFGDQWNGEVSSKKRKGKGGTRRR